MVTIPELFRTTKVPLSFSSIAAAPATPAPKKPTATKAKSKVSIVRDDDDDSSSTGTGQGSIEVLEWKEVHKKPTVAKRPNQSSSKGRSKKNGPKKTSVRLLDPRPCHT